MSYVRLAAAAVVAAGLQMSAAFACSNGAASGMSHVSAANAVSDQAPTPQQRQAQFHWDKNGQYGYWMPVR